MPDTELLTDQQIAEIADMFPHAEYQPTLSPDEVDPCEFCKGTIDDHKANCVVPHVHALIATVKQLRAERLEVQRALASSVLNDPTEDDDPPYTTTELVNGISNLIRRKESLLARLVAQRSSNKDLQSQLEQLRAENQQLKLIVDVGTNDDPGTALAKLRKIQHVAATAMRDKCVEKIREMAQLWDEDPRYGRWFTAAERIITEMEKL